MKSSVELVIELLQATYGPAGPEGRFRTYYNGDPEVIPRFNLPCIIVTQTGDSTVEGEMGEDDVTDQLIIKVLLDKRDDLTGSIEPTNLTDKRLRELVASRDDQNEYKTGTIKRMLREALLEDVTAVAPTMDIQYGISQRPTMDDESNADWTAEAHVTFSVQYSVNTYQ